MLSVSTEQAEVIKMKDIALVFMGFLLAILWDRIKDAKKAKSEKKRAKAAASYLLRDVGKFRSYMSALGGNLSAPSRNLDKIQTLSLYFDVLDPLVLSIDDDQLSNYYFEVRSKYASAVTSPNNNAINNSVDELMIAIRPFAGRLGVREN